MFAVLRLRPERLVLYAIVFILYSSIKRLKFFITCLGKLYILQFYNVDKRAVEIIGVDDPIVKNGEGINDGIGDGPYDHIHRIFRNKWHQTTARLVGKNRIDEIVSESSDQICEMIRSEMAKNPSGFDPVDVYMNGTLNVVTGFSLGIIYKFDDPDFVKLANCVKTFFKYLQLVYFTKFVRMSLPDFILR